MAFNRIPPELAARLALDAYALNAGDQGKLDYFLNNPLFKQQSAKKTLSASVGGRLFNAHKDAFGLAALGAGAFDGDLFLIFRGTTEANNKADFVTDARIGLERSKSGSIY